MVVDLQLPPVQSMATYNGWNKLIFNEMVMASTLYMTDTLCWICTVLAH
jgi:hypothetical protein